MDQFIHLTKIALLNILVCAMFFGPSAQSAPMVFPDPDVTKDVADILESYTDYLRFVLAVAKNVDPKSAHQLHSNYQRLAKYDPQGAARFLIGLRFEMVHKLELMGRSPRSISTGHPEMRRWVRHFINDWVREADEHLFRSVAMRAAQRNRARLE